MKDLDPILQQYGSVVRSLRRERHMSQEELAHQSGLHRTYITDIERGARNVSLRNIIRIAEALKLPLAEFFTRFDAKLYGRLSTHGPVTILLAVNDENTIGQLTAMMEQMNIGNDIRIARSGTEAVRMLLPQDTDAVHRSPVVLLLDTLLTALNGRDILQELRKDPRTVSLPVILITPDVSESDRILWKQFGVDETLSTPLTADPFSAVMQRLGYQLIFRKPDDASSPKIGQNTPLI